MLTPFDVFLKAKSDLTQEPRWMDSYPGASEAYTFLTRAAAHLGIESCSYQDSSTAYFMAEVSGE